MAKLLDIRQNHFRRLKSEKVWKNYEIDSELKKISPKHSFPKRGDSYWKSGIFSFMRRKIFPSFIGFSPVQKGEKGDFEFFHIF